MWVRLDVGAGEIAREEDDLGYMAARCDGAKDMAELVNRLHGQPRKADECSD